MPKGVISGGALEGSNQLGEIVTCHAMIAFAAGVDAPAIAEVAPKSIAPNREPISATRERWNEIIGFSLGV